MAFLAPAPTAAPHRPAAVSALLALFLLAGQVYLITARGFANVLETPFLPYCLLGAFAIHMATRPGRLECLATFALGALLAASFVILRPDFRWNWPNTLAAASSVGLASLTMLAGHVTRLRGAPQWEKRNTLIAASIFVYSSLFIAFVLKLTAVWHPKTYDLYLFAADAGYGMPIAAGVALFLRHHPLLGWCCGLAYESLPLAVSLLYAYEKSGSRPLTTRVLPAFLGGGVAAYLLYNILPAAGPLYIFGTQFPDHLPNRVPVALQTPLLAGAPRNAVPSMHLACALLIFWNARRLSRWAYPASALYLALTILATLGFGEHYVVDLVAGVPYALLIGAVCAPRHAFASLARKQALAAGFAFTAGWIGMLRFTPLVFQTAGFVWTASAATVAACCSIQLRFEQACELACATRRLSSFDPRPESPPGPGPASAAAAGTLPLRY